MKRIAAAVLAALSLGAMLANAFSQPQTAGGHESLPRKATPESSSDSRVRVVNSFVTPEVLTTSTSARETVTRERLIPATPRNRPRRPVAAQRRSLLARVFLGKGEYRPSPFPRPLDYRSMPR
jgi:hypothetical protein